MRSTVKEKDKGTTTRRKPGRIATACAECRRLKVSTGLFSPSSSSSSNLDMVVQLRLVLANTQQLHDRIEQLCSRIRELESALRSAQTQLSENDEHPLLRPELLELKFPHVVNVYPNPTSSVSTPPGTSSTSSPGSAPPPIPPRSSGSGRDTDPSLRTKPEDENLIDAFGTLSIRENGETHFLGQTARSEYLIRALAKPHNPSISVPSTRLSQKILDGAHVCRDETGPNCGPPLSFDRDTHELGREVFNMLPSLSEAIRLCEVYLEYGKYMYTPLPRVELFDDILSCIYRSDSFDAIRCYHSLSLLFIVFALASLFDSNLPHPVQAQEYFYLSKAALSFNPPFSHTTLKSIWCTIHIAQYLEFNDWEALGSTAGWAYVGHAVRMGTSIGFHLNSSRWNLPEEFQQRQYRLFWTVFTMDTWSSFHYGRPPSISRAYIDCPLPKDTEEFINANGEREIGFHSWSWQFTAFMHAIMEETFGSTRPAYTTIIDFDRKIRDFPIPQNLRVRCDVVEPRKELYMQRLIVMSMKENMLMHLHRAYFAQTLQDSPDDLTTHKYVASVIATYRSAWRLSKAMQIAWKHIPHLLARYHLAWSQVLSSAIVMCILVTRAPTSKMTKSSLDELDGMASLFEEAAPISRSAANILDTMRKLRRKAREVTESIQSTVSPSGTNNTNTHSSSSCSPAESSSSPSGSGSTNLSSNHSSPTSCAASFTNTADLEETQSVPLSTFELDRLGGRTHLIAACNSSKGGSGSGTGSTRPSSSRSCSDVDVGSIGSVGSNAHPSPESQFSFPGTSTHPHTLEGSFDASLPPPPPPHPQHPPHQPPTSTQNLHPTIAQDIRNIEMDVDMNFGGLESHFFDIPASFDSSFRTSPLQQQRQHQTSPGGQMYHNSVPGGDLADDNNLAPHSQYAGVRDQFTDLPVDGDNIDLAMDNMSHIVGGVGGVDAGIFGNSMFAPVPSAGAFSGFGYPQGNNHLSFGTPLLDASWQGFIEQLGF
ncbi:fungal-specific transcription factor domain-containing protein [Lentinula raphanica]|nr:fungal-specific transcription factor domain-containing protein [Lentinula raphanica]